ncbi:MAG: hypothetical protein COB53_11380 [Elusimicrobia bacterium]|nr:MAG: hypothetical protein COB53_11380 [Elusimicrobiota bacterium]
MARLLSFVKRLLAAALLTGLAAGRTFAAFEDLGVGARGPGIGNAFVAIADDVYALHYNPAGLGTMNRPEFTASYTQHFVGLSDNSNLSTSFAGYAHPLAEGRLGTIATGWNSFSLNRSQYREDSLYVSYGKRWFENLEVGQFFAGTSIKLLRSSFGSFAEASNATDGIVNLGQSDPLLSGGSGHSAIDLDIGFLFRFFKHYAVGLQVMHLNQPNMAFDGSDSDTLPMEIKAGFNYRSLISNLVAQLETKKAPDGRRDNTFTIGTERWFPRVFVGDFGIRGAMSIGSRGYKQISTGLSFRTRRVTIDYAFGLPIASVRATAGSHRMALLFRFGRKTDDEETREMLLEAMGRLKLFARAQTERFRTKGLSSSQKAAYEEYLAQSRRARKSALFHTGFEFYSQALTIVPPDLTSVKTFSRYNLVAQTFPKIKDYKSDPVQAAMYAGLTAYIEGRDLEAIERISLAAGLAPNNRRISLFLSQLEDSTGLNRVRKLESAPRSLITFRLLTQADSALEERRYKKAITLSLKVLHEEENNARAWQILGTSYFALKDFKSSLRAWNRAFKLEKSPLVRDAIRGYMRSIRLRLKKQKTRPRNVRPLPKKPVLSNEAIETIFNEGVDYYASGELEKARAAFKSILDSRPKHTEAGKALRRVEEELR